MRVARALLKFQLERVGYQILSIRNNIWTIAGQSEGERQEHIFKLLFPECAVLAVNHLPEELTIQFTYDAPSAIGRHV